MSTKVAGRCKQFTISSFVLFSFPSDWVGGNSILFFFSIPISFATALHLWLIPCFRFVNVPIGTVNKRLTRESGEAATEITNLEKKLQYHETTNQKSRENLEAILKSGRA